MRNYIIQRLLTTIPILIGISLLAFVLGYISPGDPAEFVLNQSGLDSPSDAQIAAMREQLGLNRTAVEQYLSWMAHVLQGDLGTSYVTGRNISMEIGLRLPITIQLACMSMLFAGVVGVFLGVTSAIKVHSLYDTIIHNITNIILALPGFWLALVLILCFSEYLRLLPTSGSESLQHFILPSVVLAMSATATITQFVRNKMLDEFSKQYFIVARVRGIGFSKLILQYVLPSAILPVIALMGNYFAGALGGSVIVENIFAIPGISSMALDAIKFRDYPVLQAYVLLTGWTLTIVMIGVDIFMKYLNPRLKFGDKS